MAEKCIYFVSYKIKKGTDMGEFFQATKALDEALASTTKGYVSWQQFTNDDECVDVLTFETMADLEAFQEASKNPDEIALKFYSYINLPSCKQRIYKTNPFLA